MRAVITLLFLIFSMAVFNGCATLQLQVVESTSKPYPSNKNIAHSFYFLGDAGYSNSGTTPSAVTAFKNALHEASSNSTAIFLGDNIYPKGLSNDSSSQTLEKQRLQFQIDATKNFKGQTVFVPGNHDWYSGLKGLKHQEKFVENALGKNTFLPQNGCPLDKVKISDEIVVLVVDSQWYITQWDKHPTINDNCDIKTRADFFNELSSEIKKARGKTTLIVIHNPMFSNGSHGGQYDFSSHLKPLPVLGTLKNIIRKTGGVSHTDIQNKRYNELKKRLVALAQHNTKVAFVSGHDHNLQYLLEAGIPQIISGSGSKITPTRLTGNGKFSYAANGYARLDVFDDGASHIRFYSVDSEQPVYQTEVFPANTISETKNYPKNFPSEIAASIYTKDEINKSRFHEFLWGKRYRKQYGTKIKAKTVNLDTLLGGLTPVRKGGGNQSKSLRLKDRDGRQYVMRALKKQASQYLQAILFKDHYIGSSLDHSFSTNLLLDIFTGAHPYAPFVVGDLADAVGVYHTNPVLYYVPKQHALGKFNDNFGDELYMIEEHTSQGHNNKASFGFQNKLLSTNDMMKKIRKDEDIIVDEAAYIKARLFDMLIGDWDRHQDQWRWIEFKENGKKVYRPMPRDRDQAFSKMSDGFLLSAAVKLIPTSRLLRAYNEDLVDVKGVNVEPYPIDMALIEKSDKSVWDAQVKHIQKHLKDDVIEQAFLKNIPPEVNDTDIQQIKTYLKARRKNLQKIANRYFKTINTLAVVKGTNKDDWFDIERMPNGKTKVTAYRIKDGKKADKFHQRIYYRNQTKEIWIYGLDDDDVFHVFGEGKKLIKVRLIGGQNNDTYTIKNGNKLKLYDYKTKANTIVTKKGKKKLTDHYQTNVYNYKKLKNNTNKLIPTLGFNPDDGFKIGMSNTFTKYNFERNPFTAQHTVFGSYFFETSGFELGYKGEFANVIGNANLKVDLQFNSPNFAVNFFGFGNSTENLEADLDNFDFDFYRVKIRTLSAKPSIVWKTEYGSFLEWGLSYESNGVERTVERYLASQFGANNPVFDNQDFVGSHAKFKYDVKDNSYFPTLGFLLSLETGYKTNTTTNKGFGYLIPQLGIDYKITSEGQVVLATKFRSHINFGDNFEFYQAAVLGDQTGLRGFRRERFSGKSAFVQSTDIRFNLRRKSSNFLPFNIGFYGGFDYGRIWVDDDLAQRTLPISSTANPNKNKWNTSMGGGIFATLYNMFSANLSAFGSDDGVRIAFRLGFGF